MFALPQFRCDDIIFFNYLNEQFNQYGVYIFLFCRLRQLKVIKIAIFYALFIMISFTTLFTMIVIPFYTIPRLSTVSESDILLCGPGSVQDAQIFAEWIGYLSLDTIAQIVFLTFLIYKSKQIWKSSVIIIKRVLIAAILTCLLNIFELIIFIITGGQTIRGIRIAIYCIIPILLSLEVTKTTNDGDSKWCLWCNFQSEQESEESEEYDQDVNIPFKK